MHQCPTQLSSLSSRIKGANILKYNFLEHMSEFHLENGKLPPCPPQLTVETHITKEEEALMDIGTEKTEEF